MSRTDKKYQNAIFPCHNLVILFRRSLFGRLIFVLPNTRTFKNYGICHSPHFHKFFVEQDTNGHNNYHNKFQQYYYNLIMIQLRALVLIIIFHPLLSRFFIMTSETTFANAAFITQKKLVTTDKGLFYEQPKEAVIVSEEEGKAISRLTDSDEPEYEKESKSLATKLVSCFYKYLPGITLQ